MTVEAAPPEARRTVNANEHATPQPTRSYAGNTIASTSTRALNQASSSSLAAQAAAQSSPGTTRTGSTTQITVESALAQANGWDVATVRILTVIGFFVSSGLVGVAYLAAWIGIPEETMPYPGAYPPQI